MASDEDLQATRLPVLLNNAHELIAHPRFMLLIHGVISEEFRPLLRGNPSLLEKVELLTRPTAEACQALTDQAFLFNARLAHLVQMVRTLNSVSLSELRQKCCFGQDEFTEKDTQKLVVKAVQFGLINASIDKKSNKVYFQ